MKRTRIRNNVESLGYIKYFSSISPRPVKTQAILEDTTVRRSLVDREDLSLEIGKKATFPEVSLQALYLQVFCPTFLNTEPKDKTFQQSGKQESFRRISNTSASMYESSDSHFFRNTTVV